MTSIGNYDIRVSLRYVRRKFAAKSPIFPFSDYRRWLSFLSFRILNRTQPNQRLKLELTC